MRRARVRRRSKPAVLGAASPPRGARATATATGSAGGHSTSRPTAECGDSPAERHEACAELLAYLRGRGIVANGYSPFEGKAGGGSLLAEPRLVQLAAAHNVTASQVVLNWQWRRHGVLVNPTAARADFQRLNLDFDGFALSEAEAGLLDTWPQNPPPEAGADTG